MAGPGEARRSPATLSLVIVVLAGIVVALQLGLLVMASAGLRTKAHLLPLAGVLLIDLLAYIVYVRHHHRCHPWTGLLWFVAASVATSVAALWAGWWTGAEATATPADRLLAQYRWGQQAYTLGVAPLAADPALWTHEPGANRWHVLTAYEAERRWLPRSGLQLGRGVGGGCRRRLRRAPRRRGRCA